MAPPGHVIASRPAWLRGFFLKLSALCEGRGYMGGGANPCPQECDKATTSFPRPGWIQEDKEIFSCLPGPSRSTYGARRPFHRAHANPWALSHHSPCLSAAVCTSLLGGPSLSLGLECSFPPAPFRLLQLIASSVTSLGSLLCSQHKSPFLLR